MKPGTALPRLIPYLLLLLTCSTKCVAQATQDASSKPANATAEKPKKVWTNEDIGTTSPSSAAPKAPASKPARPVLGDAQAAQALKAKLQKLEGQLKDAESQLAALKKFAAGETDGGSGRDLHRGVNRIPVPEQIQKLETKRDNLQAQISAVYDEARHRRIPPGELR